MAEKAEPVLTDAHREELEHLRSKGPVRTEPRSPEEEARLHELELMERDELWASQDARHAELTERDAKAAEFALTEAERQELSMLRKTIDDQNRAHARATEPAPKKS